MAYSTREGMRNESTRAPMRDPHEFDRLYDCRVIDNQGNDVGEVSGVWVDSSSGDLEFVSVKTGWFLGRESIVPANQGNVDYSNKCLKVPYAQDVIKKAPNYPAGVSLTPEDEERAYAHYGMHRSTAQSPTGLASRGQRPTRGKGAAEAEIPLHEERVRVRPETYETGQVRLRKVIRTETVNVPVELQHETVEIERVPASKVRDRPGKAFEEEEFTLTEREQRPVIEKTREVTGAVRAKRRTTSTHETVKTSKRKEDVQVRRENERR